MLRRFLQSSLRDGTGAGTGLSPREKKATRVPVLCCVCGEPTSMLVPAKLLEEVQVMHLCDRCAEEDVDVAQLLDAPLEDEPSPRD